MSSEPDKKRKREGEKKREKLEKVIADVETRCIAIANVLPLDKKIYSIRLLLQYSMI